MSVLGSRDWRATEGTDLVGADRKLVVTGEVEMSRLNETPKLDEAVPQGFNPAIQILELSAQAYGDDGDDGDDATSWEPVTFEKPVEKGQYTQVEIRGHATVDVETIHS